MRKQDLEYRALEIIRATAERRPVEDALVELKSDWPSDLPKMARRLAGHANAARGSSILWLIGVDEKSAAVQGAEKRDAAQWYPQLEKEFDGPAPRLFDLALHVGEKTVMALAFETDRAPYVVRTSASKPGEPQVTHEVPWREGTRVRTARREDLIRILVPASRTPTCEVMSALMLTVDPAKSACRLMVELFLTPLSDAPVCVPFRNIEMAASWGGLARDFTEWRRLEYPQWFERVLWEAEKTSPTIRIGAQEALVTGPGTVILSGETPITQDHRAMVSRTAMSLRFTLPIAGAPPIVMDTMLPPSSLKRSYSSAFAFWG